MMGGQTVDQSQLFYLFNLERRIPAHHLLRRAIALANKLRGQRYGNLSDWELIYYVWVQEGGKIEHAARAQLQRYKTMRMYPKDGSLQKAREIVKCPFSLAVAAIYNLISSEEREREWCSRNCQLYDF
jgi:hypothetical protein